MKTLEKLKQRASVLKRETAALYLACRDCRTPKVAKVAAALVVAYALSPIDLIPDFIPVLGLLDDIVLVPAGIAFAIRLIPRDVMADSRAGAEEKLKKGQAGGKAIGAVIVTVWIAFFTYIVYIIYKHIVC